MRRLLAVLSFGLTAMPCAWSQDIVIGQSVALSGANADIGRDMCDGALAVFGYNSATNSVDSLPLAARANVLFFAPFSGSPALRSHPNVFTIRASYRDEALKIAEAAAGRGDQARRAGRCGGDRHAAEARPALRARDDGTAPCATC